MSDESLFREVDEEVRQEQFKKLWDRYGTAFTVLCVAVVVAVAGIKGWQYWQLKQAETAGDAFFDAVKLSGTGKEEDAIKTFSTISHAGYAQLARLREAAGLAASGKTDDAVKAYDAIAADAAVDTPLRELAKVRAAYALADTAKPEDLAARVKDMESPDNVWRHAAREITLLSQWRAADYASADKTVQAILADAETPAGIRQHAITFSELLVPLLDKK